MLNEARQMTTRKIACNMALPLLFLLAMLCSGSAPAAAAFRPPAVPLFTYDPYFNIWSCATHLADHPTEDWARRVKNFVSLVRIDGCSYRLMGAQPANLPDLHQVSVKVWPLESVYHFAGHGVSLKLGFLTPRLPNNLAACGRPVTYVIWTVRSTDGKSHHVEVYLSGSGAVVAMQKATRLIGKPQTMGPLSTLRISALHQTILAVPPPTPTWGYLYLAATHPTGAVINSATKCENAFIKNGTVSPQSVTNPTALAQMPLVAALSLNLGTVGNKAISDYAMVAYVEQDSMNLNGTWLKPYWMHSTPSAAAMLVAANKQFSELHAECTSFDNKVWAACKKMGGKKYAIICGLAYRQAIGMMGMAEDAHGLPVLFTDENTSGGDIATVDVIYPAAPMFLLFNPDLMKSLMIETLQFSEPHYWPQPYAIHDLGAYPNAFGHRHGGGETMPVEESGNMLLLTAAIARADGGRHHFADEFWPLLTRWAHYLVRKGFDPGNQLCTDDFAGPMPHNANLSIKAIEGIGAYAYLCHLRGMDSAAKHYMAIARGFAKKWMKVDLSRSGTHYRLGFKFPHSWSQKYNLVWDQILGLNLFPSSVIHKEMSYYMTRMQVFGLPLDVRKMYTKTDWSLWTASLAPHTPYFRAIVDRVYKFLNQSPSRVGLSDFYWTNTGRNAGMYARPVVGAMFITMLTNLHVWRHWAAQGATFSDDYARLPLLPIFKPVVPTAQETHKALTWHYTINKPASGWWKTTFNDSIWSTGAAGFGSQDPGVSPKTSWLTDNIWLRRKIFIPRVANPKKLIIYCYHDENVRIYINGVLAAHQPGFTVNYVPLPISPKALKAIRFGHRNQFAVHVLQTSGGQFFDLGLGFMVKRSRH
jgi:hypothetical protein